MEIKIGEQILSNEGRPYFIADIASNHDGEIERAFKLIELAKVAGADAAKFQNFKAETIVSRNGFASIGKQLSHQSTWEKSVYETYEEASINDEWTSKLKENCDEVGIEYMTSPYDKAAVDKVNGYVNAFKIGSGDITWLELIDYIAQKKKPVLLSTGASTIEDVKRAYQTIEKHTDKIVLMQCNTNYTADRENYKYINLRVLTTYHELVPKCILGLSDHTLGCSTVLGAFAMGARVFEKHFTDDNARKGPDHQFSMNPKAYRAMVDATMELFYSMGDGIKRIEDNEKEALFIQQRGLYLKRCLKKGDVITRDDLIPLRPMKDNQIFRMIFVQ